MYQCICMHANAHVCNCTKTFLASVTSWWQMFTYCAARISWGDFCCLKKNEFFNLGLALIFFSVVLFLLSTLCEVKKAEQLLSIWLIWDSDMSHSFTGKCVNLELCLPAQSLLFETLAKTWLHCSDVQVLSSTAALKESLY